MKEEPLYLVIPAAGLGTRMRNVDLNLPKEMLPVENKPAIQYAVEEGLSAGVKEIIIIINRKKEIIRRYFEEKQFRKSIFPHAAREMEDIPAQCTITFLYQEHPRGESDAIYLTKERVDAHSVAILYPDNIYFPSAGALKILKSAFSKYRTDVVALTEVKDANAEGFSSSGKVDIEHMEDRIFQIKRLYPKEKGSFVPRFQGELRTCGISITGPHIFEYIERTRKEVKEGEEFTDAPVRMLMLEERKLLGCKLPGVVFDIGNPTGYNLCLSSVRNL